MISYIDDNQEILIHPYDHRIEKLRKSGMELVLLSFVNEARERIIPPRSPIRIEMQAWNWSQPRTSRG